MFFSFFSFFAADERKIRVGISRLSKYSGGLWNLEQLCRSVMCGHADFRYGHV